MTKWSEMPLRPQGQPWPGLNTRGGRLDPGMGYLEDGSINAIINEADILQKRKGFVRGLDERFSGPVCGLFRYTDDCGVEYLIVADSAGIYVRTPFDIPTFLGSDSFPNDSFEETLDTTRWNPTSEYETFLGSLILRDTAPAASSVATSRLMQWFKEAALTSYQCEIQYNFVAGGGTQQAVVAIKRTGTTYLLARVTLTSSSYSVDLELIQSGVSTTLATQSLTGATLAEGFLRLSFQVNGDGTGSASLRAIPAGGSIVSLSGSLTEAQVNNLGQNTAIGLATALTDQAEILQVTSGAIS